jgi:hypothetical protein
MPGATTRLSLPYPTSGDAADGPDGFRDLAEALDNVGLYGQGLIANLPAAVGISGRGYWATDEGLFYINDGTTWHAIGDFAGVAPDSITATEIAANAVGSSEIAANAVGASELADNAVDTTAIVDLAVTAGKLAAALKPSGGAGASTEALRALGTGVGLAAPGVHGSQHALAGGDPLPTDSVGAAQIQAGAVGSSEIATGAVGADEIATGAVGSDEIAANAVGVVHMIGAMAYLVKAAKYAGPYTNGQTFTISAPPTYSGTYIIEWGAAQADGDSQGDSGQITCSKSSVVAKFADVSQSGGPGLEPGVALTANEVITFTVTGSSGWSVSNAWAKLTRVA